MKKRMEKNYFIYVFAVILLVAVIVAVIFILDKSISGKAIATTEGLPDNFEPVAGFYLPQGNRAQLFDASGDRYVYNPYYKQYKKSTSAELTRDGVAGFKPVVTYYFNFSDSEGIDLWDANGNLKRYLYNAGMTKFESVDKTTIGLPSNFKPVMGYYHPVSGGRIVLFDKDGNNWIYNPATNKFADRTSGLADMGLSGFKPTVGYYYNFGTAEGINLWDTDGKLKNLDMMRGATKYSDLTANKKSYGLANVIPTVGYIHYIGGNYTIEVWDDNILYARTAGESVFSRVSESLCFDSDGGKDYGLKGTISRESQTPGLPPVTAEDFCFKDGKKLTEYFCDGDSVTNEIYDCSSEGNVCIDGACVPTNISVLENVSNEYVQEMISVASGSEAVYEGYINLYTGKSASPTPSYCIDSDGTNRYRIGDTNLMNNGIFEQSMFTPGYLDATDKAGKPTIMTDMKECRSDSTLGAIAVALGGKDTCYVFERFCVDNRMSGIRVLCRNGLASEKRFINGEEYTLWYCSQNVTCSDSFIRGDLNKDGAITTDDLILHAQLQFGAIQYPAGKMWCADVDDNGILDSDDRVLMGLISTNKVSGEEIAKAPSCTAEVGGSCSSDFGCCKGSGLVCNMYGGDFGYQYIYNPDYSVTSVFTYFEKGSCIPEQTTCVSDGGNCKTAPCCDGYKCYKQDDASLGEIERYVCKKPVQVDVTATPSSCTKKKTGESCSSNSDCCSNKCSYKAISGRNVCASETSTVAPALTQSCSYSGARCNNNNDCCSGQCEVPIETSAKAGTIPTQQTKPTQSQTQTCSRLNQICLPSGTTSTFAGGGSCCDGYTCSMSSVASLFGTCQQCSRDGESCGAGIFDACCDGYNCISNKCIPSCREINSYCTKDSQCCNLNCVVYNGVGTCKSTAEVQQKYCTACAGLGDSCLSSSDCCSAQGLNCVDKKCIKGTKIKDRYLKLDTAYYYDWEIDNERITCGNLYLKSIDTKTTTLVDDEFQDNYGITDFSATLIANGQVYDSYYFNFPVFKYFDIDDNTETLGFYCYSDVTDAKIVIQSGAETLCIKEFNMNDACQFFRT